MDSESNIKAPPALFGHCVEVYKAMSEAATVREIEGVRVPLFEGYTTRLVTGLNLSVPVYSSVMRGLKRMDCVRQIKRGGGGGKSIWALLQEPTLELFQKSQARPVGSNSTHATQAQTSQMLSDLNRRLNRVEAELGIQD